VNFPAGPDEDGLVRGPFFVSSNGETHKSLVGIQKYAHWVDKTYDDFPPPMATEEIAVLPTSPAVGAIDGCRGVYCTLPAGQSGQDILKSAGHAPLKGGDTREPTPTHPYGYPGAHSDVPTLTERRGVHSDDRCQFAATCYLDDCPKDCGGFTIWPRSHERIWHHMRGCFREGMPWQVYENSAYGDDTPVVNKVLRSVKRDIEPVETFGPAGTVVLWHQSTMHIAGINHSSDVIRKAMIHNFLKTTDSVSDAMLLDFGGNDSDDMYRHWSEEWRGLAAEDVAYARWHADGGARPRL
jgi:hypothetical protein